ncbi:hypothetical protein AURDEDRAFT_171190 [Auricularia subglabra TFB-10046 SS5]|uniref:F-box domain-containing protein n=1 Tax=Auricularia subglabra (strain TFB-10046 / SS5) TaxID=717982 RepID=J0D1M9_AURST|nr:hypothetical protein AURDEDRAFT_171190 [Auricularia subglabra TFB-10046 SS5]
MMLNFTYESGPLRDLLVADFEALARGFQKCSQIEEVFDFLMDTMLGILRDHVPRWNERNLVYCIPEEVLASCLAFLPFRDRVSASQVCRTWRQTALSFPAVWETIDIDPRNIPIDISCSKARDYEGPRSVDFAADVERHMSRVRTLSWDRDHQSLRLPAPLLENINIGVDCIISEQFRAGRWGNLKTLCT